jgi:hypothetical protein
VERKGEGDREGRGPKEGRIIEKMPERGQGSEKQEEGTGSQGGEGS